MLMDGGLSLIVSRGDFTVAGVCGPCRWMAPEVLDPSDEILESEECGPLFTLASDVYSLGMTILEVMTGKVPFSHRRYDTVVVRDVIRGIQPPRPEMSILSDDVWNILKACWKAEPESRPSASLVQSWLNIVRFTDRRSAAMRKADR